MFAPVNRAHGTIQKREFFHIEMKSFAKQKRIIRKQFPSTETNRNKWKNVIKT